MLHPVRNHLNLDHLVNQDPQKVCADWSTEIARQIEILTERVATHTETGDWFAAQSLGRILETLENLNGFGSRK